MLFSANIHGDTELQEKGLRAPIHQLFERLRPAVDAIHFPGTFNSTATLARQENPREDEYVSPARIHYKLIHAEKGITVGKVFYFLFYIDRKGNALTVAEDSPGQPDKYRGTVEEVLSALEAEILRNVHSTCENFKEAEARTTINQEQETMRNKDKVVTRATTLRVEEMPERLRGNLGNWVAEVLRDETAKLLAEGVQKDTISHAVFARSPLCDEFVVTLLGCKFE